MVDNTPMSKVLYCQNCGKPNAISFDWILWREFRMDSVECRNELKARNLDVIRQEAVDKRITKGIAEDFRKMPIMRTSNRTRKLDTVDDLDEYIFDKPKRIVVKRVRLWGKRINCPECGEKIPKINRICPLCKKYTKPISIIIPENYPTKARNLEIVQLLDGGNYTLAQVGMRYGLSRERVRQIYFRQTGHGYTLREKGVIMNVSALLDNWYQKKSDNGFDALYFRYKTMNRFALT